MKITFHLGAHATDDNRLLRSLIRNNQKLADEGIFIPGPSRFRTVLRDVVTRLEGEVATPETLDLVLDAVLDSTEAAHVVLSDENFLCDAGDVFAGGQFYGRAGDACAALVNAFPGHDTGFAIAIRNPATQIAAVFGGTKGLSAPVFLDGARPRDWRWSEVIDDIAAAIPGHRLLVWCNEDTPLIWPEVMREVSGHAADTRLKGGLDILGQIMEQEGMRRLRAYLATHPPQNEEQRRQILGAFLDKYAKPDEIDQVVDFPGWTAALVNEMTAIYEADLEVVRTIPGVSFIAP